MAVRPIGDGVHAITAQDWDRKLFDELIPLSEGTSYNAYLVRGSEKTALIDSSDPRTRPVFEKDLRELNPGRIDYIISSHSEQDHSGCIPFLLNLYPDATILSSARGKEFLKDLLEVPSPKIIPVKDGETLSLGGRTLRFLSTPWVHWPETMMTHIEENRILCSCDLFGSHLATSDLYADDEARVYEAAKMYYAQILMPFRHSIRRYLDIVSALDPARIAPSHGPVYRKPGFILDAYRDWVSDRVANEVVVVYVSMHGSVSEMVQFLIDALVRKGLTVRPFNVIGANLGKIASALVDAATLVVGSPTVLTGPHPAIVHAAYLVNALRPKLKHAGVVGSCLWGGKMAEQISGMVPGLKAEVLEPVVARGLPKQADFAALEKLAEDIASRHRALKILS